MIGALPRATKADREGIPKRVCFGVYPRVNVR
jgi:hypothetical protein